MTKRHNLTRILALLAGFLLLLGMPGRGPAQSPGTGALRQKQASLAALARGAVIQVYGLDSRLGQARADLAAVQARADALSREQASVRLRYQAAQRTAGTAERRLGDQLRYLYEQGGDPDPIAVVLGAKSLEQAVDGLDAANRAARVTESVLGQARATRTSLVAVREELALQAARTNQTRARLAANAASLEHARAERFAYLAGLRHEQQLTAAQIARVEQQAQAATAKAREVFSRQPASSTTSSSVDPVAATTPSSAAPAPPGPPRPGGKMTVYATGYCLRGSTATGLRVGPGVVAVDPSVIPLGTRMTIPGYGKGVAADIGGAIKGARIDVWIKSCADAAAFTRTVTITFL